MWDVLATLYEGSFKQRKMILEEKMQTTRMHKGERICNIPKWNNELIYKHNI